MAKGRLVASVVSQELLQELYWFYHIVNRLMNQNIQQHVLVMFVTASSEKPLSYQGYENHHLKRGSSLADNFTTTTSTLEVCAQKQ